MFPIKDVNPTRSFPFINYLIIVANILVFLIEISAPNFERFVNSYAFIPGQFDLLSIVSYQRIIYSMFLHGGWFHLLSNVWFLHIFGDNVEDQIGHLRYVVFYFFSGVAAVFAQYIIAPQTSIPLVGASGAISGVAGAYFVMFKHSKIEALVPTLFGFWDIITLPAWFFLGYWFVIQVLSGVGSLGNFATGGVAFFAHIGGFVFGYLAIRFFPHHESSVDF